MMEQCKFFVVERGWEAVLCRVDSEAGNEIDGTVVMDWQNLRQAVIDLYNDYAAKHPGTCPDFFIERFAELGFQDPIPAWIGSKSPLVYHVLGQPGMVTIGCAALAFGRALNHGWAILATPDIGDHHPGWWPEGWGSEDAEDAKSRLMMCETAGAVLDEILRLDHAWRSLFDNETACRNRWFAASSGLSYESESRYAFCASGDSRCSTRLVVRTSQFGAVYIDLDDGNVSVDMEPGHLAFHDAYKGSWLPDQMKRYIQELVSMGAWLKPSATSFLEAKALVEQTI